MLRRAVRVVLDRRDLRRDRRSCRAGSRSAGSGACGRRRGATTVTRPCALRPPLLRARPSSSERSGVAARELGEVRDAHLAAARRRRLVVLDRHRPHTPSKNSIVWPSASRTIAFFHCGLRPMKRPTRRVLRGMRIVRTSTHLHARRASRRRAGSRACSRADRPRSVTTFRSSRAMRALLGHERPLDHVVRRSRRVPPRSWRRRAAPAIAATAARVSQQLRWRSTS